VNPSPQTRAREKATEKLYKAVESYIKANGGSVVVIGGICIVKEDMRAKFNYGLMVRITGKLPKK